MNGRLSAYAVLGLRPGADRAQIDEAYRRLIKLHHPDRPGGDSVRAAEINRAYRELRDGPPEPRPIRVRPEGPAPRPRRLVRWRRVLPLAVVVGGFVVLGGQSGWSSARLWAEADRFSFANDPGPRNAAGLVAFDNLEEPLSGPAIDRSIADAVRLHRDGGASSILQYSQTCQAQLRNHPSVVWFDTCAAYDEAIAFLQNRDPSRDSGPFDATEVTSREMGDARLLSDDAVMAEARVHLIRDRVGLVLLSQEEAAEAAALQAVNSADANMESAGNEAENLPSGNDMDSGNTDSGD